MIFVTDFDGTLYSDFHKVSDVDFETFIKLGSLNIKRVIATGRSYFSALKVIPAQFPIDYLIFSSGAGIMEWENKKIIKSYSLNKTQMEATVTVLKENKYDFMLHKKIPDNHYFWYYKASVKPMTGDFESRCAIYSDYCKELEDKTLAELEEASQFVVVIPCDNLSSPEIYEGLKEKLKKADCFNSDLNIIRTTSPIDKKTLWIEIFPKDVSKAKGIKTIADMLSSNYNNIAAVGNDFNDLDMLRWVKNPFVVENSPIELKNEFMTVKSNNENGFTDAVNLFLKNNRME